MIIFTIIFVVKSLEGFGWIILAQRRRRWPSITSALGQCIVLSGVSGAGILKVTNIMQQSEKMVQSPNAVSLTGQHRRLCQHWNSIGWMTRACAKHKTDPVIDQCWVSVVDDRPALNQQRAAALAQHWTGIWWVGLHPLYQIHRRQVLNECWPPPAIVVEVIHVEYI